MPDHPTRNQPYVSLIYLLLLAFSGALVFIIIGYIIGIAIYGTGIIFQSAQVLSGESTNGLGFLKLIQIFSTIGTFIVPALFFAKLESKRPAVYLRLSTSVNPLLILLAIAVMLFSTPVLEWTVNLNKQMQLPEFLAGLESWMRMQEDQLEKLTFMLLNVNDVPGLLLNLLMIAVLPAIGEELIFRGCLQKIFTSWTKSYHWGIWLAAIIFSTIHLQFYGFLPRMLLGALFGYLLVWSGSLWIPILAHFVNNAAAVITAYFYVQRGESLEKLNETGYDKNIFLLLFSLVVTAMLLQLFYRRRTIDHHTIDIKNDAGRLG